MEFDPSVRRYLPAGLVIVVILVIAERSVCPALLLSTCDSPLGWLTRGNLWFFVRYGVLEPTVAVGAAYAFARAGVAGARGWSTYRRLLVGIWGIGTLGTFLTSSFLMRTCVVTMPDLGGPSGCYTLLEYTQYSWGPFLRVMVPGTLLFAALALVLVGVGRLVAAGLDESAPH